MTRYLALGVLVCALQANADYTSASSSDSGTTTTNTTTTTSDDLDGSASTTSTSTTDSDIRNDRAYDSAYSGGMSETTPQRYVAGQPTGWAGFVQLSSGYTGNNDEIPIEGVPSAIKLLGSFYTLGGAGVFDLGAGTQQQTFIDVAAAEENTTTSVITTS